MKSLATLLLVCGILFPLFAQQSFVGSGLNLILKKGSPSVQVESILYNSPAARTNLRPGEVIQAVNGVPTAGLSIPEINNLINGPAGTEVILTVGETRREVKLTIAEITGFCQEGDCENGKGSYVEIDGSRYEGQFKNGRFDGVGTIYFGTEAIYSGQFQNGLRHGKGVEASGSSRYEGEFRDNIRDGHGKLEIGGNTLEGEWVAGRPKGQFTISYANGNQYRGDFHNGTPHGFGVMTYANGHRFEGQWADGAKTEGKYTWPNGEYYEGAFDDKGRTGQGAFYFLNGARYEGGWKNDEMDGEGKITFPDGAVFEGMFSAGKASGMLRFAGESAGVGLEDAGVSEIVQKWTERQ
ncbi:MAG: PDZ domain-containing protein [Lewinellaceae bacterium]|nr:PDZ domain-containing protein [Lewinellaceae bacterium]